MEPKSTNADEKIDQAVAFWRTYPVPPSHVGALSDVNRPRRSRVYTIRFTATALACVIAVAIVLSPSKSRAVGLARSLAAMDSVQFCKTHAVSVDHAGKPSGQYTMWQRGSEYHLRLMNPVPDGSVTQLSQEIWLRNGSMISYQVKEGYADRQRRTGRRAGFVAPIDAKTLISRNGKGGVREFDDQIWHGHSVIRYELSSGSFKDGQGITRSTVTTLYVDSKTYLPLEMAGKDYGYGSSVLDFEYPAYDPSYLAVSLPPGVPLYDLDEQRAMLKKSLATPLAETEVGGKTIALRALVLDHEGFLAAWTTGGASRPEWGEETLRVDGLKRFVYPEEKGLVAAPTGETGTAKGKAYVWKPKPELFNGVPLVRAVDRFAVGVALPERLTVRIPIWQNGSNKPMGWAEFKNVRPTVTGLTPQLMWPRNEDIFIPNADLGP